MLRRASRAQSGIQRLHDQALVGAERSRVGIWLGLCDSKQTAKTYTDARMLPLKEAIRKLSFHRTEAPGAVDTQLDTQTPVFGGHLLSTIVTLPVMAESEKSPV